MGMGPLIIMEASQGFREKALGLRFWGFPANGQDPRTAKVRS